MIPLRMLKHPLLLWYQNFEHNNDNANCSSIKILCGKQGTQSTKLNQAIYCHYKVLLLLLYYYYYSTTIKYYYIYYYCLQYKFQCDYENNTKN